MLLLVVGGSTAFAAGERLAARDVLDRVGSAVVGIRCRLGTLQQFSGTGIVIDPTGLVLTSTAVVPRGAREIRVFFLGGRVERARLLTAAPEVETSLLRIAASSPLAPLDTRRLAWLPLGDDRRLRLGDPVYSVGNAFGSLESDDQVTLASGLVSGRYPLAEPRPRASYRGPVIETSAALNTGMSGGPLLDARGEVVGLLSPNFSRSRWLGTAVPIHRVKPVVGRFRGWFDDRREGGRSWAGLELHVVGGREIRVLSVEAGGPAERAGLRRRDRLVAFDGREIESLDVFGALFRGKRPGERITLRIDRDGTVREVVVVLGGRY